MTLKEQLQLHIAQTIDKSTSISPTDSVHLALIITNSIEGFWNDLDRRSILPSGGLDND